MEHVNHHVDGVSGGGATLLVSQTDSPSPQGIHCSRYQVPRMQQFLANRNLSIQISAVMDTPSDLLNSCSFLMFG